ncbi:MAG: hypothetical protein FJ336_04845, partial [Sphingomonadales bacterium]|nr:hypothetical protein [Sphingomonadales bacterium]
MSVPAGFAIAGNPITGTGTLALTFAAGYSLPTNATQATWTTAYNDSIISASVTGTTTKTLTLNQQDGGTIQVSWSDFDTAPVTSVFGRTGDVIAQSGDYTTTLVTEGTNLYYTDARARAAISSSATGLTYTTATGVLSFTAGYSIPTNASQATWDTAYNNMIVSAAVTGTTTKTLTLDQQDGGTITASWSDYDTAPVTSVFGRTGAVVAQAGDYTTTLVTEGTNLYYTNARARLALSLTTTGSSGAATYDNTTGVFNVPQYTLAGLGGVPDTRTLTINGTTYDLSANRTWSVGTVTSVDMSVPTGFAIGGNPVTSSGTLALTFASGYSLPTNAVQAQWDTAYNNRITSLTTTGTSGAATLTSHVLNIPQYQAQGNYITSLTGEATASGPGAASVTLTNSAVIGKVLTGLNITGGSILDTDTILSAFGKLQNQINATLGGLLYQGVWNANTNTPTLTSSVGVQGYFYIVNVAGTTNLNGITDWQVGDWAVFDGSAWQKVDNTDSVTSVNGFTGAVSLTTTNISEGTNLYFTNSRARQAISLTTTGSSGASTYDNSTGIFNIPQYTLAGLGGVPD